jgi:YbgC/YbaW family acyl-CoA thioester hydrolase
MTHEKIVEIRWSDVDAYLHVNNALYATYLEECRDEWVKRTLEGASDPWDFVLARVANDFRRELRLEDEEVVVSCAIERIGNSSVTLREQIHARRGAWLSARLSFAARAEPVAHGAAEAERSPERASPS